jgi:hypothetical protein
MCDKCKKFYEETAKIDNKFKEDFKSLLKKHVSDIMDATPPDIDVPDSKRINSGISLSLVLNEIKNLAEELNVSFEEIVATAMTMDVNASLLNAKSEEEVQEVMKNLFGQNADIKVLDMNKLKDIKSPEDLINLMKAESEKQSNPTTDNKQEVLLDDTKELEDDPNMKMMIEMMKSQKPIKA